MTKTIVYFKHGLGNLIMLTPVIKALSTMDESGKVDVCLSSEWNDSRRPAFDEFFKLWDVVEDVVNYPREKFTKKYTTWFYTGHSEHSEAFDYFREKNPMLSECPDWKDRVKHEAFWYMDVLDTYGYNGPMYNQEVPVKPIVFNRDPDKIYIGICNGTYSNKMKNSKQWHYFQELVDVIKMKYDNAVIVKIGYGEELSGINADIDYVDKLSFCESAGVISTLDLFITTDTANMHVADALLVNTVALFGATFVSKNGPINKTTRIVTTGLKCQPCQRTPNFYNCEHYSCMTKLTVGDVMQEVDKFLK